MATRLTSLCSLAAARAYVGVTDEGDTAHDSLLTQIADGVSESFEQATGRRFVTRTLTEYHDGHGDAVLFLHYFPVISVTSIKVRRSPSDAAFETVDSASYRIALDRGAITFHDDHLDVGRSNVEVIYSTGYGAQDAATLPGDVYLAALDMVKALYTEAASGAQAASAVNIGNHSFIIKPDWPKHVKQVLTAWRRAAF